MLGCGVFFWYFLWKFQVCPLAGGGILKMIKATLGIFGPILVKFGHLCPGNRRSSINTLKAGKGTPNKLIQMCKLPMSKLPTNLEVAKRTK